MIKLSDYLYIEPMGKVLRDRREAEAAAAAAKRQHVRRFAAAQVNRLNADWTATPYAANWTLYRDLRILRARAREMAKNAPHFSKFLKMAERNVIGHQGIRLQCRAKTGRPPHPNTRLNELVENEWWLWSHPEHCSASGKLSLVRAQKLFIRQLIRDGEVLVEHVAAPNPFGYALKFWNVDWLDETYNEDLPNGNRIIMSVEVDANDRPVAYWLTTPASEMNFTKRRQRTRTRYSAEIMTHAFLTSEDESQTRGVTWFHAALMPGKGDTKYTGAVIESASMTAMSGGFFTKANPDAVEFTGEGEDGEPDLSIDHSPAAFHMLPEGWNFQQFDPKQPTQNHAEFKRSMLLDIAAGLDVCGFSLGGDMSAVNYSSARVGLGEERDVWRDLQTFTAEFLRLVFHKWLLATLKQNRISITAKDYQELQNPEFKPRGWRYVDPHKEITAHLAAITGGIATVTSILSEQGIDLEDFLDEKQREMEMFEKAGIPYPTAQPAAAGSKPDEDNDDESAETPPDEDGERGYLNGKYAN